VISANSDVDALRFSDAWKECCIYLVYTKYAIKSMDALLPLDEKKLSSLDLGSIQDIDQLVYRYSKPWVANFSSASQTSHGTVGRQPHV
jgi:hypothetical protein